MRKIILTDAEANVLEKIAGRSKMDDWFSVKRSKDGREYAREDDVTTLADGATPYDLETLTPEEVCTLIGVLLRCNKIKST